MVEYDILHSLNKDETMKLNLRLATLTSAVALTFATTVAVAAPEKGHQSKPSVSDSANLSDQGYFFAGGKWVMDGDRELMLGQTYVQYIIPKKVTHATPIVMVPGTGQTGIDYFGTPDGRKGWAQYFAAKGYKVYVIDQVARGRSGTFDLYGKYGYSDSGHFQELVTAQENFNLFPQAKLHTQWPGGPGVKGNAAYDQFFATQVPYLKDSKKTEELNNPAIIALLEQIGPSVLMVHSQSGVFGWGVADQRPDLVKAIAAIEPNGPGFYEPSFVGGKEWYKYDLTKPARPYGITRVPLNYSPAITDPAQLQPTAQEKATASDQVVCYLQAEPAHKLPNLTKMPIAIFTGEAGNRATMDGCTSAYLTQAGVKNTHIKLADQGVHGNGHLMMLEKNSDEVANVIEKWVSSNVK